MQNTETIPTALIRLSGYQQSPIHLAYLNFRNQPSFTLYKDSAALLTYLLTPWCRVLLEKLIGLQLVK